MYDDDDGHNDNDDDADNDNDNNRGGVMDFRELNLNFDGVVKNRELRVQQFAAWKAGELEGPAAVEFEAWLPRALSRGRVYPVGPGMVSKVRNFLKSSVKHVRNGRRKATKETREWRLAICKGCRLFNRGRCRHPRCGCSLRRKIAWASESCPIGMWGRELQTEEGAKTE